MPSMFVTNDMANFVDDSLSNRILFIIVINMGSLKTFSTTDITIKHSVQCRQ